MNTTPTSQTRLIALLGDPVGHSLSPVFQNAAILAAGVDGVYLALRCAAREFAGLMTGIARAGGGGNVTIPHKERAAENVQRRTDAVVRTGACNTFWLEDGCLWGDNTDVAGFAAAASVLVGRRPTGSRVLLVGAGGAARAALASLVQEEADEVVVFNRTEDRAAALASLFPGVRTRVRIASSLAALAGQKFDLAVNATSLGIRPTDPFPLPVAGGPSAAAVLDLVYSPGETRWVRELRARGVPSADGIEMLLHQGAAAFERWWGREAPLDIMRSALRSAHGP